MCRLHPNPRRATAAVRTRVCFFNMWYLTFQVRQYIVNLTQIFLIDKTVVSAYKAALKMKRSRKPDELCVALDEIGESGYHLSCVRNKQWVAETLREAKASDCGFEDDVSIQLDFFKTGRALIVRGNLATALRLRCVRCLEDFTIPLAVSFHYQLLPEQKRELPQEMEIPKEEFDTYYYSGAVVDLGPLVLEQIILHIPVHPLCRESCKGICQHCGADLNRAPCSCAGEEDAPSPFAVLKDFSVSRKKKF